MQRVGETKKALIVVRTYPTPAKQGVEVSCTAAITDPTWSDAQLGILRQGHLFQKGPDMELEKIPYKFQYKFYCDESSCTGHTIV